MRHKYSFFSRKSIKSAAIVAASTCIAFVVGVQTAGEVHPVIDSTQAGGSRIPGDINSDNLVTVEDAQLILEIVRGYRQPTAAELLGDPNQDYHLTIDDAIAILERISNK